MKAEETVMMPEQTRKKRKELFPHGHKDCFECEEFVRKAQAEISFKAGREQEHKAMIAVAVDEGNKAYRAGKKEVVEWINDTDILIMLSPRKRREWQSKLKDWGIE